MNTLEGNPRTPRVPRISRGKRSKELFLLRYFVRRSDTVARSTARAAVSRRATDVIDRESILYPVILSFY